MKINTENIFLVDAFGAVITGIILFIVGRFEHFFGMPAKDINILIPIAAVLAIYSFSCYFGKPIQWRKLLILVACLNLLYCLLTLGFVVKNRQILSFFGYAYFLGEVLVIVILARFEFKLAKKT